MQRRSLVLAIAAGLLFATSPARASSEPTITRAALDINLPCPKPARETDANGKVSLTCMDDTTIYMFVADIANRNESQDDIYQHNIDGLAKAINGKLRSQTTITVNGLNGREFLFDGAGIVLRVREFISGEVFFGLSYVGPVGSENNKPVATFLDSLKVK
jgi:hypothetical protein